MIENANNDNNKQTVPPSGDPPSGGYSSQISGYIDALFALFGGTFGSIDTSNPPNSSTQSLLNLFIDLLDNNPDMLDALSKAPNPSDAYSLYQLLNASPPPYNESIVQMAQKGDRQSLYYELGDANSPLNQIIQNIQSDYPSGSVSYQFPGSLGEWSDIFETLSYLNTFSNDYMSKVEGYLNQVPPDTKDALPILDNLGDQIQKLAAATYANQNDGFCMLMQCLLNSSPPGSSMTLEQFANLFHTNAPPPSASAFTDAMNLFSSSVGSEFSSYISYCLQWMQPPGGSSAHSKD